MTKEWEDIEVNRRDSDKVVFESHLVQSIYDGIGFLRDETTQILKEIDTDEFKQQIDEFDVEEFGQDTMDQFSDIADDLSKFKNNIIDPDDVPEFVKEYSKNAKIALNREGDYLRRARRKLDKLDSDKFIDVYRQNIRVVELCDKAIKINPKNYESYYLKGLALTNLEKYANAIDEFIKSLALNEDYIAARLAIANANRLNNDYDDAISVYDSVLKTDENSFDALKGKAYTYFDAKNCSKASEFFKKASKIKVLDDESKRIWDKCLEN